MNELLQERYAKDPWKMLMSCILLNQTSRKQVERLIDDGFFGRYPDAASIVYDDDEIELRQWIRSLGLGSVRMTRIKNFSEKWEDYWMKWLKPPTSKELASFPGIGSYAVDSYRIFFEKDTSRCDSGDKELVAWAERNGIEWGS